MYVCVHIPTYLYVLFLSPNKLFRNKLIKAGVAAITALHMKAIPTEALLIKSLIETRLFSIDENSGRRPDKATASHKACSLFFPLPISCPLTSHFFPVLLTSSKSRSDLSDNNSPFNINSSKPV